MLNTEVFKHVKIALMQDDYSLNFGLSLYESCLGGHKYISEYTDAANEEIIIHTILMKLNINL